jgi:hypothetical protein
MSVIILSDLIARKKAILLKKQVDAKLPLDEASLREIKFLLDWITENPTRVLHTENGAVAEYYKASGFTVTTHPDSSTVVGKTYSISVPDELPRRLVKK